MPKYYVTYSAKGARHRVEVEAPTSTKAVRVAREMARAEGLRRVMLNLVEHDDLHPLSDVDQDKVDRELAERLMANRGPALTVDEINAALEVIVGIVPLKAVERDGHILLDDGVNEAANGDDLSLNELVILCYEWAVFTGETSETFDTFVEYAGLAEYLER